MRPVGSLCRRRCARRGSGQRSTRRGLPRMGCRPASSEALAGVSCLAGGSCLAVSAGGRSLSARVPSPFAATLSPTQLTSSTAAPGRGGRPQGRDPLGLPLRLRHDERLRAKRPLLDPAGLPTGGQPERQRAARRALPEHDLPLPPRRLEPLRDERRRRRDIHDVALIERADRHAPPLDQRHAGDLTAPELPPEHLPAGISATLSYAWLADLIPDRRRRRLDLPGAGTRWGPSPPVPGHGRRRRRQRNGEECLRDDPDGGRSGLRR